MKEYEIWSEGFRAMGDIAGASFHGKVFATSFKEACIKHFGIENFYFDEHNLTFWGCKLFDNEIEARKNFG